MSFVDDLARRYDEQEMASTRVPEWAGLSGVGENGEVYSKPLTLKQLEMADAFGQKAGTQIARLGKIAQYALRDERGNHLIRGPQEYEQFVKKVDGDLLARVLQELGFLGKDEELALAEKNSEGTPEDD